MNRLALGLATFGYVGYVPFAPGTAGSLAALVPYALVRWIGNPVAELLIIVVIFMTGVWAATASERALGATDPGPVVIDEVAGMLITLAFIPLSLVGIAAGFLLFRLFDVVKPYPAGRLEHAAGGWGVMLDDTMAGLYGQAALRVLAWLAPAWFLA